MPWYKTGTVNVTLNSNAVTGTGTAFIVNCRVGDAFRGPDGRWYEVTNAPSDSSLSIDPPYQGATTSGGSYALAPMQGYVKDSADALRSLVNTYGAKLAALGTTGNYDILPVSKGGTGGTTPTEARTGLELGTAATRNVTQSASDSTAGRVLKVGDFGIGAQGPVTTPNAAFVPGFYSFSPNAAGAPSQLAGSGGSLIVNTLGGNYVQQICMSVPGSTSKPYMSFRHFDGVGNPGPWCTIMHSGNMVGTVSQSGGVPTGAVIEYGTNTNGSFVKWADGTMVCIRTIVCTASSMGLSAAPIYSAGPFFGTVAVPFASAPTYFHQVEFCSSQLIWIGHGSSSGTATQGGNFWLFGLASAGITANVSQIAWGRWY